MKARTKQTNGRAHDLSPGLVAAYRAYPAINLDDTLRGMAAFLAHGRFFRQVGDTRSAAATERAWWQDAVLVAGEPARSEVQARRKVAELEPALDGRTWLTDGEGYLTSTAMIAVAVEAERRRWHLEMATRH